MNTNNDAKLMFLGSGGGRVVTSLQNRATGGIILELDGITFHVDPGPGALVNARRFNFEIKEVDVILVSHGHIDHFSDVFAIIDAIRIGKGIGKGILISNEFFISDIRKSSILGKYLKTLERVIPLHVGEEVWIQDVDVIATKTWHQDENGIGFIFRGSKQISYLSDTKYSIDLAKWYSKSDVLIISVLGPYGEKHPYQMSVEDAIKLINNVKPGLAIFTHFGIKMIGNIEFAVKMAQEKTLRKVVAARDGLILNLSEILKGDKSN